MYTHMHVCMIQYYISAHYVIYIYIYMYIYIYIYMYVYSHYVTVRTAVTHEIGTLDPN